MTSFSETIENKLKRAFPEEQSGVLVELLSDIKALTERDLVRASDFNELKEIVRELAEAQRRTEERLGRLETVVTTMADAQRSMEQALEKLVVGLTNTRADLGGLQRSFGYMLENEAYRSLPAIMQKRFGVEVKERFLRKYFMLSDGTEVEINVLGKGLKNGDEVTIIGEAKSILEGKDVDRFLDVLEGLKQVVSGQVLRIFVTHSARPSVEKFATDNRIQVIYTYEL